MKQSWLSCLCRDAHCTSLLLHVCHRQLVAYQWMVGVRLMIVYKLAISSPELWGVFFCFLGEMGGPRCIEPVNLVQVTFKSVDSTLYWDSGGSTKWKYKTKEGEEMGSLLDEGINKPPRWNIWLYTLCQENSGHTLVTLAVLLLTDLQFWWAQPSRSESWVFSDEFRNWSMLCRQNGWHWEGNKKVTG